jgi:hypothetical protein
MLSMRFCIEIGAAIVWSVLLACQTADGNLAQPIAFQVLELVLELPISDSRRLVPGKWEGNQLRRSSLCAMLSTPTHQVRQLRSMNPQRQ